jgi:antitoxin (DNA-binding transcriptional repressor) of toxin-antitoxin stability system
MTRQFTLREAKAKLSQILDLVAAGEHVEILRKGRRQDRFRIIGIGLEGAIRRPGALKGRIRIPDGFDDEDAKITAGFEGCG